MLLKVFVVELQHLLDVLARQRITSLEQQQHRHLISLHRDQIRFLGQRHAQLAVTEMVQPRQLPPAELHVVERLEVLNGLLELLRHRERNRRLRTERPRARLQNLDGQVDVELVVVVLQVLVELVVQVHADADVGVHAVQLVGKFIAARLLQFVDHHFLQLHVHRLVVN